MANKKIVLKQLADYFAKKGSILSVPEYKAAEDKPMRYMVAKRPFGSWHRMTSMVKRNFPEQWEAANANDWAWYDADARASDRELVGLSVCERVKYI